MSEQDKQTIRDICGKMKHKSFDSGYFCPHVYANSMMNEGVKNLFILGFLSEKETLVAWFGEEEVHTGLCWHHDIDKIEHEPQIKISWKYYGGKMLGLPIPERLKIFREEKA